MNNRDINNFEQLIFPFKTMRGGGAANGRIFHSTSDYSTDVLFDRICSVENIFTAWEKFVKGKRSRKDVMSFERQLEHNLFELQDELVRGRYLHNSYMPFTVHDPKKRAIHKATVRDRVVHQAIVNVVEPVFERRFIFDSYSCRKEKGTHAASYRLRKFLRKISKNNTITVYALKCDVNKFFDSVDHSILLRYIARHIAGGQTFSLIKRIIVGFERRQGKGLPIGNLTSQLFANIYMHEFDHFIKYRLRERWYVRYCDDFILLSTSRQHLLNTFSRLKVFLHQELQLSLHPHKVSLRTWGQGIDLVGYIHLPHATILRKRTERRMLQRVSTQNYTSYLGLCNHANTYELRKLLRNKVGRELVEE